MGGGIGGGGRVSAQGAVHMGAILAGCRKALVSTGWAISTQMGIDKASLPLYIRDSISGTVDSFQLGDGRRALTI